VLESVFETNLPLDEIYDLKGSVKDRHNPTGKGILKDLNIPKQFLKLGELKPQFMHQLEADIRV
jgi:hypothetical protein